MQSAECNWQSLGEIAQRMAMAADAADEKAEAHWLVENATERQRAVLWRQLWDQGTDAWRLWAQEFLVGRWVEDMRQSAADEAIEQ